MVMRQELVDLIQRIAVREPLVNSDDSISWHALREAEKLDDESLVVEIDAYLAQKPRKEQRSAAYFIIGKIGKNCSSEKCASLLIEYSSKEHDKYALAGILDRLADIPKPESVDVTPLFQHLNDARWLVRRSAIGSLAGCHRAEVEDRLLDILATTLDPYDAACCHSTLNKIGTRKSIPSLEKNLKSRKRDVKLSARYAIAAIEAREAGRS